MGDEGLFGVQVLVVGLSNDSIVVETEANLLQHSINICVVLVFAAFAKQDQALSTFIDKSSNIL